MELKVVSETWAALAAERRGKPRGAQGWSSVAFGRGGRNAPSRGALLVARNSASPSARPERIDQSEILTLDSIRTSLIRQEDSIIFGLLERAQYCYNADTYDRGSFQVHGFEGSLVEFMVQETEKLHAKVGRYQSPDEHPFFPEVLPETLLPPIQYPTPSDPQATGEKSIAADLSDPQATGEKSTAADLSDPQATGEKSTAADPQGPNILPSSSPPANPLPQSPPKISISNSHLTNEYEYKVKLLPELQHSGGVRSMYFSILKDIAHGDGYHASINVLHPIADSININKEIWKMYFDELLPRLVRKGSDGNSGSSALCDTTCLQALSKRIHYGKFVAEAKFQGSPGAYIPAIIAQDRDQLMKLLTFETVERAVEHRVESKARIFGQEVIIGGDKEKENGAPPTYKIRPSLVAGLYSNRIMPLTKDVQVAYLLRRLD